MNQKGKNNFNYKHGLARTRPYKIWDAMMGRCYRPKNASYKHYGGKGIEVCPRWKKISNFWSDMQVGYNPHLTLDRIDNNKNYCKSNCRWATWKEQANNKTQRKNKYITNNILEESRKSGINPNTLYRRLSKQKLTLKEAIKYKKYAK